MRVLFPLIPDSRFPSDGSPVWYRWLGSAALAAMVLLGGAAATAEDASSRRVTLQPLAAVDTRLLPALDLPRLAREDERRAVEGEPYRIARGHAVQITPENAGTWEWLDARRQLWRLRIRCPGCLSMSLGFTRFDLPWGATLRVYPAEGGNRIQAYSAADNEDHGQLWTPVVLGDDLVVELEVPADRRAAVELELTRVNRGYRLFGESAGEGRDKSGACNIDVVCPEADAWRAEIRSVAVYAFNDNIDVAVCTGALLNNTAQDQTPYFLTAAHCPLSAANAPSMVVYWNFESPVCDMQGGGNTDQNQTGAILRARSTTSDFVLVELDDPPLDEFGVTYAGWDRGDQDPTAAVAIHHPSTDEKSISFENDPCTTTSYLQDAVPGDDTHIRVEDWDLGTTESGSSGSPLFDENHHVVGQLHGGYASCINNLADWYGRLSVSWTGGGTPDSRLRDWLDPLGSGVQTLELLDPMGGLQVQPAAGLLATGDSGGPFAPASQDYTLTNPGDESLQFAASADVDWVELSGATGTLAPGGSATVTVSIAASAAELVAGRYRGTLNFENVGGGAGNTSRRLELQVGTFAVVYSFPFASDPGWNADAGWGFGVPGGGGGEFGGPDPTAGATGTNVFGYNLAGDYENDLPERHLTSTPLNCRGLSATELRCQRWLGVEERQFDAATVALSTDGLNYTEIWRNQGEVSDTSWIPMVLDISAIADGQPSVYVRWTMGPTDFDKRYCGWNVDDVEIWAFGEPEEPGPGPSPTRPLLVEARPNPMLPAHHDDQLVKYYLPSRGQVNLRLYDMRGRLVRVLVGGQRAEGENEEFWDGRVTTGGLPGSGVYIWRLEAPNGTDHRKITVIN